MVDINLKQLEAFVATVKYESFTRAAEVLYLTQSTVSTHIAGLEQTLGSQLILRGARQKLQLTEEGQRAYKEAVEILQRCHNLQEVCHGTRQRPLQLGASSVPGQYLLPDLLTGFLNEQPESRYVLQQGDSMRIYRLLEEGTIRIGFVGMLFDQSKYEIRKIAEDRLVLITANREPYRALRKVDRPGAELLKEPLILREGSSGTRHALEDYLRQERISLDALHPVALMDDPDAIKASVIRGMGVAVVSDLSITEEVKEGKLLPFELTGSGAFRSIYLVWRKDLILRKEEEQFLRYSCDCLKN